MSTVVWIPGTYTNARWVWWPQSKLASYTSRSEEFWVQPRDPVLPGELD